jgi:hypothetical protein
MINEINQTITKHRKAIEQELKKNAYRSSREYKLRTSERKDRSNGLTFGIGITFERHGVFVEKGVGKGRGINSGKTNPMPWFNPVMDTHIPLLADDMAVNVADLLQKALIK